MGYMAVTFHLGLIIIARRALLTSLGLYMLFKNNLNLLIPPVVSLTALQKMS